MTNVIPLTNKTVKPDVIRALTGLLERANKGHVIGLVAVIATAGGEDETTITGEFAADLGYARAAAREGFDLLLGHWSEQAKYTLPRRLRTNE